MSLRNKKPVTPGSRFAVLPDFKETTKSKPEKRLTVRVSERGGRNNQGRITSRHRGGGRRRLIRLVDFREDKSGVPGKVLAIEYDPNRNARLALIQFVDGEKRYILATQQMKVSDKVISGAGASPVPGNRLSLKSIPEGNNVCALEIHPGRGAQMLRAAGASAVLMSKTDRFAQLKLPSGEVRLFSLDCTARIGVVGNVDHRYQHLGKAGRNRWRGRRPRVRGVAMNPVDHPLGGGEGKSAGGRPAVTPWGKPEGIRTRNKKKPSRKFIVASRREKK